MRYLTVLALLQITSVFAQVSNSRLPMLLADTSLFEKPVYVQTTKQEAKQQVKIRELKILVHKKKKNYPKIDSLLSLNDSLTSRINKYESNKNEKKNSLINECDKDIELMYKERKRLTKKIERQWLLNYVLSTAFVLALIL